jgi:hypothetical protein
MKWIVFDDGHNMTHRQKHAVAVICWLQDCAVAVYDSKHFVFSLHNS